MISSADQPFALLIDDVGLKENAAAHGQARHRLGLEGAVGVFLKRDPVALGHALQKCAVAGRALRIQAEIGDRSLPQDHDLHVGAADVADHVGVREDMQSRFGVRHGLDHAEIGAEDVAQQILAVAGKRERRDLPDACGADVAKERLGVLDRIALRLHIGAVEQFLFRREHDGLGGGAAEVAADEQRTGRPPFEPHRAVAELPLPWPFA